MTRKLRAGITGDIYSYCMEMNPPGEIGEGITQTVRIKEIGA